MNPYDALGRWIDAHHGEQIEFLREVVRVPTDMPPGDNAPAAEKTAALLASLGFAVERHPVSSEFLRDYGMQSVTNLIVRERFGDGGPTVALNAHGNVVPPGEGWTKPPYDGVIENGRMYARSVAVSKSDIATYTYALAALRALVLQGAPRKGSVELHFTYDEEFGGLAGPAFLLENKLTRPLRACGELQLRCRHRAQRLPAARGDGPWQIGPRRDAGNGARCVSRWNGHTECDLHRGRRAQVD